MAKKDPNPQTQPPVFKEGTEEVHVQAFRAIRAKATELDEKIDAHVFTPQEAMVEFAKFMDTVDIPAPKKEKAEVKEPEPPKKEKK